MRTNSFDQKFTIDGWQSDEEITEQQASTSQANGTSLRPPTAANGHHSHSADEADATTSGTDLYITHKVTKYDTMAGLAVKYNVSVSDIKRINGLLSDSAMYARDTLLIPRESLQIGQEYSAWAAMIITRHGRLADRTPQGLLSMNGPGQTNEAIEQLKRYYNLSTSPTHAARGMQVHRSRSDHSLLEMSSMASFASRPAGGETAGQSITVLLKDHQGAVDDRVRRRRVADGMEASTSEAFESEPLFPPESGAAPLGMRGGKPVYARPPSGKESLVQKIKRVATANPAIAQGAAQISQAAGGLVNTLSEQVKPGFRSLKKILSTEGAPAPAPPPRVNAKKD